MSLSGGRSRTNQSATQNQTSSTALTDWSRNQWESQVDGILGATDAYTSRPYQSYDRPMVAGLSDTQRQARDMITAGSGSNGILGDAADAARAGGSMTWTPESVSSTDVAGPTAVDYRTFDPTRVEARMNPYEDQVVDAAGAFYDEQLGRRMSENQARATASGAFGGSRHGVADAELQRTSNIDRSQMMSDLRYRGWNDAVAGDERESGNLYTAGVRNSDVDYGSRRDNAVRADDTSRFNATRNDSATQFNSNQRLQEAGILGNLAGQQNAQWAQQAQMLSQFGATEREIAQAQLLADRAEFDRAAADELQRFMIDLQTRQGILGATPLMTTNTGSGSSSGTGSTSGFQFGMNFSPQTGTG